MLEKYAYLCNLHKCKDCTFPECSHMTDEHYRCKCIEETEMRLVGTTNGVNYYMEYVKHDTKKFKIYFYENGDHDGIQEPAKTTIVYAKSSDEAEKKFKCTYIGRRRTFGWVEEC